MSEITEMELLANLQPSAQDWQVLKRPLKRLPNGTMVLYASRAGIWRKARLVRYIGVIPVAAVIEMADSGTIKVVPCVQYDASRSDWRAYITIQNSIDNCGP